MDEAEENREWLEMVGECVKHNDKELALEYLQAVYIPVYRAYPGLLPDDAVLEYSYPVGGAQGGSCWGTEVREYSVDPNDIPGDGILDAMIMKIIESSEKPMTYGSYTKLFSGLSSIKKSFEHTDTGYYGNFTNRVTHYVRFEELWNFLKEVF